MKKSNPSKLRNAATPGLSLAVAAVNLAPATLTGWLEDRQCTVDQREKLRLQHIDSFSLVLPTQLDGKATARLDPKPEGKR
jgi:hypothetical protein